MKSHCFLAATLALMVVTACSDSPRNYSSLEADLLVKKISADSVLTEHDYDLMLTQLDGMLEVVCEKAQTLVDSGYKRTEVRPRLKRDSTYMKIYHQSGVLDSMVLKYIFSPGANHEYYVRYRKIQAKHARKAQRLGLN